MQRIRRSTEADQEQVADFRKSKFMSNVIFHLLQYCCPSHWPSGGNKRFSVTEWDKYHGKHALVVSHWELDQRHSRRVSKSASEHRICDPKFSTLKLHLQQCHLGTKEDSLQSPFIGENVTSSLFYQEGGFTNARQEHIEWRRAP